jgi:hypothetical protein
VLKKIPTIIKYAIQDLPNLKYLERCEPGFSTLDEKKQLRVDMYDILSIEYNKSIYDDSRDNGMNSITFLNHGEESFDLTELKVITKKLANEIEEYLHYGIESIIRKDVRNVHDEDNEEDSDK